MSGSLSRLCVVQNHLSATPTTAALLPSSASPSPSPCLSFPSASHSQSLQMSSSSSSVSSSPTAGGEGSKAPKPKESSSSTLGATLAQSAEASMYSSRQIHVFQPSKSVHSEVAKDCRVEPIEYYPISHLREWIPNLPSLSNSFQRRRFALDEDSKSINADHDELTYNQLIHDDEYVMMDIVRRSKLSTRARAFIRAGPRAHVCWQPGEVVAAITNCGGLCPGLNDVICELFSTLYYNYGVNTIYGIKSGFRGFYQKAYQPWIEFTPANVINVFEEGGTVLGSSRGGFDCDKMFAALIEKKVNQLYIIGGDGTHRAAQRLAEEAKTRKMKLCVIGIPKTIDNDVGVIDRSFGFSTAVTEARRAIQSAVVEASCAPNGVGLVQLMGRHAGYIAAHAALAARRVDLCLIPEIQFPLTGPHGVFACVSAILKRQGYAVIVVAEGAGMNLIETALAFDESGNRKLPEPGKFLQNELTKYFKQEKIDASIKYIDPSYMIRSVPADASDAILCQSLAQNAVHGAMAGLTAFTSGLVNNRTVLIPFELIGATSPSYLNPEGRTWERVLSMTHQPKWSAMPPSSAPGLEIVTDKSDAKSANKKAKSKSNPVSQL